MSRDLRETAAGTVALALAALALAAMGPARAQETDPLRTRNLSPLVSIFGLPAWEADLGTEAGEVAVVGEIASHFRLAEKGSERLVLDGETWRVGLFYKRRLGERWSVGVEVPVYRQWGGILDDVIDAWHSAFNLPEGNRNRRPDDQLEFRYEDQGASGYFLDAPSSGLGDIQVSLARQVGSDGAFTLRAAVKLPTGDADLLAGSGAADFSLTLLKQAPATWRSKPGGLYWGAGVMKVGEPDFFAERSEDWVVFGVFGGSWRVYPRLGLKAQLDLHSRFYDSALDELGRDSIQASIGGYWVLDERRRLDFAINEDLVVRTAPDVSLHVGFSWGL
jgi:hypothetical protein